MSARGWSHQQNIDFDYKGGEDRLPWKRLTFHPFLTYDSNDWLKESVDNLTQQLFIKNLRTNSLHGML